MSLFSPMESIDKFLFKKSDEFKESGSYQKLADFNSTIEQDSRDLFNFLLSFLFFLIPIALVFYFFMSYRSVKKSITKKEEVAQEADRFMNIKNKTVSILRPVLSSPKVNSEADFLAQVKASAGMMPKNEIILSDFLLEQLQDGLVKVETNIKFKNAYNQNFSQFIENLSTKKKVLFIESNIKKNKDTDLLEGSLRVVHFSK